MFSSTKRDSRASEVLGRALALDFQRSAKEWDGTGHGRDQTYLVEWQFLNDQGIAIHRQRLHVSTATMDGDSDEGIIEVMDAERARDAKAACRHA